MRNGRFATLRSKNISTRGPLNCRSLHSGRDDKGEGGASIEISGYALSMDVLKSRLDGQGSKRVPWSE